MSRIVKTFEKFNIINMLVKNFLVVNDRNLV